VQGTIDPMTEHQREEQPTDLDALRHRIAEIEAGESAPETPSRRDQPAGRRAGL